MVANVILVGVVQTAHCRSVQHTKTQWTTICAHSTSNSTAKQLDLEIQYPSVNGMPSEREASYHMDITTLLTTILLAVDILAAVRHLVSLAVDVVYVTSRRVNAGA